MENIKRRLVVFSVVAAFILVFGSLTGFIFYQMWYYSAVSFALLAVPLIIASLCIVCGVARFLYSLHKMRSGERFYLTIFKHLVLWLWVSKILDYPVKLKEKYNKDTAGYWCILIRDWYGYECERDFSSNYFENAKTSSKVCSWIMRVIIAVVLHYVWIVVLFSWLFSKAERQMFDDYYPFLLWYKSNQIIPIDIRNMTEDDVTKAKEKLERAKEHVVRAEQELKQAKQTLYFKYLDALKPEYGPLENDKYSLSHCSDEVIHSFVNELFVHTYIYNDNFGPDASGLTHKSIVFDHIYKVDRSADKAKYFAFLKTHGTPITYPNGLSHKQYPRIAGVYPVLTSKFINDVIKEKISLDTEKEVILVHGTKNEFIESILQTGLQSSKSRSGLYGKGIYLSDSCQKADRYADHRDAERLRTGLTMLLLRVSLGDLKPQRDNPEHYDSLVGGLGLDNLTRFREFIIREDRRCCIEYVIHYHREFAEADQ